MGEEPQGLPPSEVETTTDPERLRLVARELLRRNIALQASEERYHKMVDEVQDYAIIFLDQNGVIQNWNKGAQKIKQYEQSEVVGQHFRMFYLPEDRLGKLPEILLHQATVHGRAIHEGWRMRKDRTKFWGSITLTALFNEDRQLIGFSKLTRDLTERKMAEDQLKHFAAELQLSNQELRNSEERYHKMISEVQDYAIILLDGQGNIQNWNAGAEKIKGYTAEEIIGKNFRLFYTPQDQQNNLPQQLLTRAANEGRAIHEGWRVTKNGKKFWGSIVITAMHADDGSVIGFSKVTRDLTEKKQADDRLKAYLLELQKQNRELDQFAYAASHDLQEPLRKIVTFADLIGQRMDDPETVRKYTEKISDAAQRMTSLVRSVLEYSRLSKDVPHKRLADLQQICTGVIGDLELLIQEKQASISIDPLPPVPGIPEQVSQLLYNLLGNALKFADKRPVIHIRAREVQKKEVAEAPADRPEGHYIELAVSDNGIGFEPRYAQQIFSLFQRLHGKHEYGGTGVGLALCKRIMENHDGWMRAESEPGQGATFYTYFPLHDQIA